MTELEQILDEAAAKAMSSRMVVIVGTPIEARLLVYPLDSEILVGVGFAPEQGRQVSSVEILKRRSRWLARFGNWLPAQLQDGSWYVVRRVPHRHFVEKKRLLQDDELQLARELLS